DGTPIFHRTRFGVLLIGKKKIKEHEDEE
nr:hypothetical protein [Tanacetum cinerariifolium]